MKIEVVKDWSKLEKEWRTLSEQSATASFFQTFDWVKIWLESFGQGEPYILTLWEKELVALTPFLKDERGFSFWGTAKVLGQELVTDFGDIVVRKGQEEKAWRAFLLHFKNLNKPQRLSLHFLRESSPSFDFLKKEKGGKLKKEDVAPFIDLPSSWEEYLLGLERKKRHELERKIRRLEATGAFEICATADIEEGLDNFFRLVRLSNDQKRDFLKPEMENFFRTLVHHFFSKDMIDLCFLDLEGQRVATTLSFIYKDEILLYNSGFDPALSYLSPGFLLKAFLIKRAIENGRKKFDFLRGEERYKYDLGAKDQNLYQFIS